MKIVLTGELQNGKEFKATALSMKFLSLKGAVVAGDDYYIKKAVKLGAKKAK